VRLALLTEIPAPYRLPLFSALAARIDLHVLFLADRDPRRSYPPPAADPGFAYETLPGRSLRRGGSWVVLSRGVERRLAALAPDAVLLGGWNQPAHWRALAWARRGGLPALCWVESTTRDDRRASSATRAFKRAFAARCAGVVVPGRAAREYVETMGVPAERIATAPNAVDLALFGDRVAEARRDRDRLRTERGLTRTTFLTVARLAPEKGHRILFEAFRGLDAELVLAGTGPDEARLRGTAPEGVRFLGHVPQDELPAWYACADVFVLPSVSEPWGMVLNEAAAAGLPLVATTAAGAAWDLVEPDENGFRLAPGDAIALREALERLAGDSALRGRAGRRSAELSRRFTPDAWANAVVGAVATTIGREPAGPTS